MLKLIIKNEDGSEYNVIKTNTFYKPGTVLRIDGKNWKVIAVG